MRADNKRLSVIKDALGLGASVVDTAFTALNEAIDIAKGMNGLFVVLEAPGAYVTKIQRR